MLRLRLGGYYTKRYKEEGLVYLPDFVIYDLDEREYNTFWHSLKNHPKDQLYTDGIQVYKVGLFQYLFQSFKGWLGFDNHCQINKVEITLAKIAYHGYLRGFHSKEIQEYIPKLISEKFLTLIISARDNQKSAELQKLLMTYYLTYSTNFHVLKQPIKQAYPYGQTLISEDFPQLIPAIDPQDLQIISQSVWGMHHRNESANRSDCFSLSPFAEAYAEYLVGQGKYIEALNWSRQVKDNYKGHFINFYLSEKNIDHYAAGKAVELIASLAESSKLTEQNRAVNYIKQHFNNEEQLYYLRPYTGLSSKVSKAYLEEAKTEKNRNTIVKFILGNKVIPLLSHAVRLDPNILDQDSSMQDIIMKEEWIIYQFNAAISDKRFADARILYEKHPDFKFDKNNLSILRIDYLQEIDTKTNLIRIELANRNVTLAEKIALEQIESAKKIAQITPLDNPLIAATIEYSHTLLKIDIILHPKIKEADLECLNKAQELLNQLNLFSNSPNLKSVVNKLLLRKIDCLSENIKVSISFDSDWREREEFVKANQNKIDALKSNISTYISLNEKNKTKEARPILAKMYYLLGDIIDFYFRNKEEAIPHFKKASEVLPENLYYRLRYYELSEDENRHDVLRQINDIAYLQEAKYNNFMTERWNEEKFMSQGMDIHNIPAQEQGVIASISRIFS